MPAEYGVPTLFHHPQDTPPTEDEPSPRPRAAPPVTSLPSANSAFAVEVLQGLRAGKGGGHAWRHDATTETEETVLQQAPIVTAAPVPLHPYTYATRQLAPPMYAYPSAGSPAVVASSLVGTQIPTESQTGAATMSPQHLAAELAAHSLRAPPAAKRPRKKKATETLEEDEEKVTSVTPWRPSEDSAILRGVSESGCKWSLIAQSLPGRSDNAVRNRWHRLEKAERQRRESIQLGRPVEGYRCRKCGHFKKGHMCLGLEKGAKPGDFASLGEMSIGGLNAAGEMVGAPAAKPDNAMASAKRARPSQPEEMHVAQPAHGHLGRQPAVFAAHHQGAPHHDYYAARPQHHYISPIPTGMPHAMASGMPHVQPTMMAAAPAIAASYHEYDEYSHPGAHHLVYAPIPPNAQTGHLAPPAHQMMHYPLPYPPEQHHLIGQKGMMENFIPKMIAPGHFVRPQAHC